MRMTAAESLALETFLACWDYEANFKENLLMLSDLHDYHRVIVRKEHYEFMDISDLIIEIKLLAMFIQKTIDKELKKANKNDKS